MKHVLLIRTAVLACLLTALSFSSEAMAAIYNWAGAAIAPNSNKDWSTITNWSPSNFGYPGQIPGSDTAIFPSGAPLSVEIGFTSPNIAPDLASLTFNDVYKLQVDLNNTLKLEGPGIAVSPGKSVTITNNGNFYFQSIGTNTAGPAIFNNSSTGNITFFGSSDAGTSSISNQHILGFTDDASANAATITNSSNATTEFTINADAGHSLILNDGILVFDYSSSANAATIQNSNIGIITFSETTNNSNTDAGSSLITNEGTLNFAGTTNASNATIINQKTLNVGKISSTISLNIGSLSDTSSFPGSINLVNNSNLSLGALGKNDNIFGVISGTGTSSLTKLGNGTLTLNGANTYNGTTTVQAGILTLDSNGKLGNGNGIVIINPDTQLKFIHDANASPNTIVNSGTIDISGITNINGMQIGSLSDTNNTSKVILGDTNLLLGSLNKNDTLSGTIYGTGSLTKIGSGTLTLNGPNTYTGTTTVQGGTLAIDANSQLKSDLITVNPSTILNFINNAIASPENVIITNNGLVNFNNTSSAGTAYILNKNKLTFNDTAKANSAIIDNSGAQELNLHFMTAPLSIGKVFDTSSSPGKIFLYDTALSLGALNTDATIFGPIAGNSAGSLTKVGTGILTLKGNNTYTGSTIVQNGTLVIDTNSQASSSMIVNSSGTLDFIHNVTATPSNLVITNHGKTRFDNTSNAGTATINNDGLLFFNDASTANLAKIDNSGGTLDISDRIAPFTLSIGRLFDGTAGHTGTVKLGNTALTIGLGASTTADDTLFGIISGAGSLITTTGSKSLTLNGANTYTGTTTVQTGILKIDTNGQLGTGLTTINSLATLDFINGANAKNTIISNNGNTFFHDASNGGTAQITNNAILNFNDTSNAGSTNITNYLPGIVSFEDNSNAGISEIINNNLLNFNDTSNASNANIVNNGKVDVHLMTTSLTIGSLSDTSNLNSIMMGTQNLFLGALGKNDTILGQISGGNGSLNKIGNGTLTLNGVNTYTGPTNVTQGTLVIGDITHPLASVTSNVTVGSPSNHNPTLAGFGTINGNLTNYGIVSPGDTTSLPGTLTVNGNFIAEPNSIFQIDIDKGGLTNTLAVTGTAMLGGGTVQPIILIHGFDFGSPYTILTSTGGVTGKFENLDFAYDGVFDYSDSHKVTLTFNGIKPVVADTPASYANQLSALAKASDWFDAQLEEHILGYANGKKIDYDPYSQTPKPDDPTLWLAAAATNAKLSEAGSGFDSHPKHTALGLEWATNDVLSGFGLAYTHFHTEGFANTADAKVDGGLYQAGAYRRQDYWDWRLGAAADAGFTSGLNTQQSYQSGTTLVQTSSSSNAYQLSAQAEAAYTGLVINPHFNIQPLAALQCRYLGRSSFTQNDNVGLELSIHHSSNTSVRSQLGAAFEGNLASVYPFGLLTWEHEYGDNSTNLQADLQSISTILNASSAGIGRDALATKLGLSVTARKVWNFAAFYEGRFAKHYSENAAKVAVNYSF